jgi:mannobiose 2-epimerase
MIDIRVTGYIALLCGVRKFVLSPCGAVILRLFASKMQINEFREQLEQELRGNILPFWMAKTVDTVHGGFYGAVSNNLAVHNEVPRSAILCARILWTFARAYRGYAAPEYLALAQHAYDYLTEVFWDPDFGGVYWSVDQYGNPVRDRKHHYAQAFAIYGLSEYYRITQEPRSLQIVQALFDLLEKHAYDPVHGGYIEGSSRSWGKLEDMRLSTKEINSQKSMNTMLHILEAYTNLLRVWEDEKLKNQHKQIIEIFIDKIVDSQTHHFNLLFDDQWNSLIPHISYGHDIEGSWLLVEAAEVQGDAAQLESVQGAALKMAEAVYRRGRDVDGSLFYEGNLQQIMDASKSWWVQAEAMVGFYNAYQLSGDSKFLEAVKLCWAYIQSNLVDHKYGDWLKERDPGGNINEAVYKAGPWECPYHHGRTCLEMIERLEQKEKLN